MWFFLGLGVLLLLWQLRRSGPGQRTGGATTSTEPVRSLERRLDEDEDLIPVPHPDDSELGTEDDWIRVASNPVSSNAVVDLIYQDGSGVRTRRRVTVREFEYDGPVGYLEVYCHLRRARRTFMIDRVVEAVDPETGEVLPSLHAWLKAKYDASPEKSLDELYLSQRSAMRILLYVSKADGRFSAAERAIVRSVARRLTGDDRITDGQIDTMLRAVEPPSKAVFQKLVRELAKSGDTAAATVVLQAAGAIVGTQARVHTEEQAALEYMGARLAANP